MNLIRIACFAYVSIAMVGIASAQLGESAADSVVDETVDERTGAFYGTWHSTRGQKSILVNIEPGGEALLLRMQRGSHSMDRIAWKPFHGGILIESIPRMRLWPGQGKNSVRAEIESISEIDYDADSDFGSRFFMRRIDSPDGSRAIPELLKREVPEHWAHETLGEEWDASLRPKRSEPQGNRQQRQQAQRKNRGTPAQPDPALVEAIIQRKDAGVRADALQKLEAGLAADASDDAKRRALATLLRSLTAKFDREPFRHGVLPMLESEDEQIRRLALQCLPGLEAKTEDLERVIPLAEDPSPKVRKVVALALIQVAKGKEPERIIPPLMKLLHDSDPDIIEASLRSMWGQYSSPEFDALLIELSRHPKHHGRAIYHALSTMRPKSLEVCARLIEELDDPNWNNSGRAAWGLTYGVPRNAYTLVEEGLLGALPEETNAYTRKQEFDALRGVASEASRDYLESVVASDMESDEFKQKARKILRELDRNG